MYKPEEVCSKFRKCVDMSYNSPEPSGEHRSVPSPIPIVFLYAAQNVEPIISPSVETSMMMSPYPSTRPTKLPSGSPSAYPSIMPYLAASKEPSERHSKFLSSNPSA